MLSTECEHCHWRYPSRLLNFMYSCTNGKLLVCGICALELSNALHKLTRKKFDGPMSEQLRLEAVNWRTRHPDLGPKEKKHAE